MQSSVSFFTGTASQALDHKMTGHNGQPLLGVLGPGYVHHADGPVAANPRLPPSSS